VKLNAEFVPVKLQFADTRGDRRRRRFGEDGEEGPNFTKKLQKVREE
jgi:hypothetical protein